MLKRGLRWFVLWSARPPLLSVYRSAYWLVIWFATLVLRRYRSVLAIYLCRGCAKNQITPGISDIDFAIFITNNSTEKEAIQRTFQALDRATRGVIEYYPNLVTTVESLAYRWRAAPAWQYRYLEGRTTWTLLHGTDVLASLSPLTETQRRSSCYAEMNRWWLVFAKQLFNAREHKQNFILQNVACYKAVSELLNVSAELQTGRRRNSRAEALEDTDFPLAKRLAALAAHRFLTRDNQLMDETFRFLVTFFLKLWDGFHERPFLHVYHGDPQGVAGLESEVQAGMKERQHVQALQRYLETFWGEKRLGTHLVKSAFWDFDDLLWIIDVDQNLLPTIREVTELTALHHRTRQELTQNIFLFLRVDSVVFPITPAIPRDLHRGLLTPATMPDVFLQLGSDKVYWTDYTQWYLADWQSNQQWLDASDHKKRQLSIIAKTVESGHVVYPLTLPALEHAIRSLT